MIEIDDRDLNVLLAEDPARDSGRGSHDGRDDAGRIAVRDFPPEPEPEISRPNIAPAYYLGHPARLWITVMRPGRRRRTSHHARQAVTGDENRAGYHGMVPGWEPGDPAHPAATMPSTCYQHRHDQELPLES